MQITCEKCQTSYAVDDGLIPASGAPVQCTKCGNLFTAYPPAARTSSRTVMMFAPDAAAKAPTDPAMPSVGAAATPSTRPTWPAAGTAAEPPAAARAPTDPGLPAFGGGAAAMPATQNWSPPAPRASSPGMPAVTAPAVAPAPVPSSAPPARSSSPGIGTAPMAAPTFGGAALSAAPAPAPIPAALPVPPPIAGVVPATQAVTQPSYPAVSAPPVAAPLPAPAAPVAAAPVTASGRITSPGLPFPAAEPPAPVATPPMAAAPAPVESAPVSVPPSGAPGGSRPGRVTQMFFTQGDAVDRANKNAQVAAAGEANRKPGQTQMFMAAADLETQLVRKSRAPLYLAAGLVVAIGLGIAAAMFLPALMGPPGSDRAAVAQYGKAMALVRLDDPTSLAQADSILAAVLKTNPKYLDAEGLRALVLELRADDLSHRVKRLGDSYLALQKEVAVYNARKEPADWMQKVNADIDAMKKMHANYDTLSAQQQQQAKDAFELAQKVYKGAPDNLDALRALAFYYADNDDADKTALFVKKYGKILGKKDGWADLVGAELDAHGPPSDQKRQEGFGHLVDALHHDPGLVRAHYLRVVLDTGAKDEAAAKDDLTALLAANPKHDGGKFLLDTLEESLARDRAEKAQQAARAAEAAKANATAEAQSKSRRRRR